MLQRLTRVICLAVIIVLTLAGCATSPQSLSLSSAKLANGCHADFQPATASHLEFFELPDHSDVLVEYNEKDVQNGWMARRAYFVRQNEKQILKQQTPKFVPVDVAKTLLPVSSEEPAGGTNIFWASISGANRMYFLNHRDQQGSCVVEAHCLPIYVANSDNLKVRSLVTLKKTGKITVKAAFILGYAGLLFVAYGGLSIR